MSHGYYMARLFIAVPVDEIVQSNLARVSKATKVRGASWAKAENLHVTLAFLGDVEERRFIDVEDAVYAAAEQCAPELNLIAQGLGAFPNEMRAKVFWAGLEGDVPQLMALQAALASELKAASIDFDDKRFHPHITLARFRQPQPVPVSSVRFEQFGEWQATEIQIIESVLQPAGSKYFVRSDVPLGVEE